MAIFHLSATIHSRGKGHSSVNGAAYRARDAITDERTGTRHDYGRNARDVLFAGIYAPKDAPAWTQDRAQLWNHVEAFEKRRDAQLARVFDIALPHELTLEQNRRLLQDWVRDNFTRKGLIADAVIHAPDKQGDMRNTHAHVAVVLRKLDGTEFAAKKERTATNDERLAELDAWRASWEKLANRHLERAGLDVRIDRRTLKEQGIDAEPTQHLGALATTMDRRDPGSSELANANREIKAHNAERKNVTSLESEIKELTAQIIDLNAERAMRESYGSARGRYEPLGETHLEVARAMRDAAAERAMQEARDAAKGRIDDVRPDPIADRLQQRDDTAQPAPSPEMRDHAEQGIPTYPAPSENAPEAAATRPNVAPETEPEQAAALTPENDFAVDPLTPDEIRSIGGILGGILDGISKPFEGIISALGDMFSPPPPPTKDQAERAEQAERERQEQAAAEREAAEREARFQSLLDQMGRNEERRRQRGDDDRGRERQRGRERGDDYEREM